MQIPDDLVQYITGELIKRLGNNASPASKPRLRLVGGRNDLSTPTLAQLQEAFDLEDHQGWDDPLPPEAAVLITRLNIQALVRVAEGDEGCTPEGRVLLTALLNGQKVAALKEGLAWRRYMATAPKALLARYAQCENILQNYGLKLVTEDEAAAALLGRCPFPGASMPFRPEANAAPAPAGRGGRQIMTESELMKLCPPAGGEGQELRLAKGTLITPLAQDYIRAMKIQLV